MISENSRKILFYSIKICGGKMIEEIVSKSSGSQVVDRLRFIPITDRESFFCFSIEISCSVIMRARIGV